QFNWLGVLLIHTLASQEPAPMWCMHPQTREEQNHHCGSSELALKPLRCLLHEDLHRGYSQSRVQRLSEVTFLRSPTGRVEHVRPYLQTPNSTLLQSCYAVNFQPSFTAPTVTGDAHDQIMLDVTPSSG